MPVSFNSQVYPIVEPPVIPAYTRPSDWLHLPFMVDGEEKFAGLFPVFDDDSNFLALLFEGDYTVDWGDGSIEDYTSGATAEHTYTFSSINPDTLTAKGYRQVVVTVTPQVGQSLSYMDVSVRHSNLYGDNCSCPWLDIALSVPNAGPADSLVFSGYNNSTDNYLGSLEILTIYDTGGCESLYEGFYYFSSLRVVEIKKMASMQTIDYLFDSCAALTTVKLPDLPESSFEIFYGTRVIDYVSMGDIGNVTSGVNEIFYGGDGIKEIFIKKVGSDITEMCYYSWVITLETFTIEDASLLEYADYLFDSCYSLKSVSFPPTPNLVSAYSMFNASTALESVQFTDLSALQTADYMFSGCYSLRNLVLPGTPSLTSISYMMESCYALEKVYFSDLSGLTDATQAFSSCPSLKEINLLGSPSGVDLTQSFQDCFSLSSLQLEMSPNSVGGCFNNCSSLVNLDILDASLLLSVGSELANPLLAFLRVPGISVSFSLQNCSLSRDAIVQVFNDLAIVVGETIDVSGNWGSSLLSPTDLQIAIDKGWLVIV